MRSLCLLPGGLRRFVPCSVGANHCRSEGFPRTRLTKRSCACDCGRGPVSVGAFFFLLLSSSSLTQNRGLKLRFVYEKAMF